MSSASLANSSPLRVVFDTNIYIAAFLRPGLSEELLRRGCRSDLSLFYSPAIIQELEEKLTNKFLFPKEQIEELLAVIKQGAFLVQVTEEVTDVSVDPDDNRILECAAAAKAHLIISLDQDLLHLKNWRGVAILHPKTFHFIVED